MWEEVNVEEKTIKTKNKNFQEKNLWKKLIGKIC